MRQVLRRVVSPAPTHTACCLHLDGARRIQWANYLLVEPPDAILGTRIEHWQSDPEECLAALDEADRGAVGSWRTTWAGVTWHVEAIRMGTGYRVVGWPLADSGILPSPR